MKNKIIDELKKIEAYLYVHSDDAISHNIARNIPLTKTQQDKYFSNSKNKKRVLTKKTI